MDGDDDDDDNEVRKDSPVVPLICTGLGSGSKGDCLLSHSSGCFHLPRKGEKKFKLLQYTLGTYIFGNQIQTSQVYIIYFS